MGNVTLNGNLQGGVGYNSGSLYSVGAAGTVLIKGSVIGALGDQSGLALLKTQSFTVNGSVVGGAGLGSGRFHVSSAVNGGSVTLVKVMGSVRGGSGNESGRITTTGNVTTLNVAGSVIGGSNDYSGHIDSHNVTTLAIGGNIQGGSVGGAANLSDSGSIRANRIQTLTIGGSVIAGMDNTAGIFERNGSIIVSQDIGSATIKGSLRGNSTHNVTISAYGAVTPTATADVAIGSLTVNRRVEYTQVLAGVSGSVARNADAQIGTITVDGDWYASSVSAGVSAGVDGRYGTGDDVKYSGANVKDVATVSSKIGNLTIKGRAFGTTALGDNFGVVAENFGIININGNNIPLTAGNNNDDFFMGLNSQMLGADFRLNEI